MMDDIERQKMVADAILCERAMRVLKRRFYPQTLLDPVTHASVEVLRVAAAQLRYQAREDRPWDSPDADIKGDINENFARAPERTVFE
jgi:hypothetical protein